MYLMKLDDERLKGCTYSKQTGVQQSVSIPSGMSAQGRDHAVCANSKRESGVSAQAL